MVSHGCPSVMKEASKAESAVNCQDRQARAAIACAEKQKSQETDRRECAPRQVDVRAGPGDRQVRILSQILSVVSEMQKARRRVQGEQPGHELACTARNEREGHWHCRLTVRWRAAPWSPAGAPRAAPATVRR